MTISSYKNPFIECTARDMSYEEVFRFWCSPFGCYRLDEGQLFSSHTPLIIEGARGSGKTMILKYLSYFCQKEVALDKKEEDVVGYICKKGGIGFYYRYNAHFDKLIHDLSCSDEVKKELFCYYYDLFLSLEILNVLEDIQKNLYVDPKEMDLLADRICSALALEDRDIKNMKETISEWTYEIDEWIRNYKYYSGSEERLKNMIHGSDMVRKLCNCIKSCISRFKNVELLILIDEYENVKYFQEITNTWIRRVDSLSACSYRIGTRPQGISTYNTEFSEEIRDGRDFILCPLNCVNMKSYKEFIKEVTFRRLNKIEFFKENSLTDITRILGTRENFDDEASRIVQNKERDIFDKLHIPENVIDYLWCEGHPLMQMMNIVWYLRGKQPEMIQKAQNAYLSGTADKYSEDTVLKEAHKYKLDYSGKYRLQLLCVLCGLYKVSKSYYSFNTFAYLSTGVVNDFISLCRNTFYHLDSMDLEDLLEGKTISVRIQTKGAEDTANEQLNQIQVTDEFGSEMYNFAMNIGYEFEIMHKDIQSKYPETTQFAFENEAEIDADKRIKAIKDCMIKWGVIQKKSRRQRISIGMKKGNLYNLNKIFMPIFNMSYRTRGGFNYVLKKSMFESLLGDKNQGNDEEETDDGFRQMNLFEEGFVQ